MRITKYKTVMNEKGLPELVKENAKNYECENLVKPELIVNMMKDVFQIHKQTEEYLYEICFTAKMKPIGVFEISHGSVSQSIAGPREVFQKALICGASRIAIVHNHPSGDCEPSEDDHKVANRFKEAGKLLGVSLIDSIIIGESNYYSFNANLW